MAQLGESGNPVDLVPGDPAAIEENVRALRGRGQSMSEAGDGMARIDAHSWRGKAGDEFREKFSFEPNRWRQGADSFEHAAAALDGYASTLRWAQSQAAEAIHRWDAAQAATGRAKADHQAATSHVEQQNKYNATYGDGTQQPLPAFTDPGEAGRQAAHEILNRARQQLAEAADRAAQTIWAEGDQAPETGFWEDVGGFFGDIGSGIGDVLGGTGKLLLSMTGISAFWDDDFDQPMVAAAAHGAYLASHPIEFAKELTDWNTWADSPGRAIGHLLGGAALAGVGGKIVAELAHMPGRHAPTPGARYLDNSGIPYTRNGVTVPTKDLQHPMKDLVDESKIDPKKVYELKNNPPPGLPESSTEVRHLAQDYHARGPVDPKDLAWPDPGKHPDGFQNSQDRHPAVLEPGARIDRFGQGSGRFLSPEGVPYHERALPSDNLAAGYHRYEVVKEIPVWAGTAAPAMGMPGGGAQYLSPYSVNELVAGGYLKEVGPK